MQSQWPPVSIIIPHWKGADILHRCLKSIDSAGYEGPLDVAVVDNASPDGSMSIMVEFPHVRVIESQINRGYAGGCNWGIRNSEAPYVVLLNDDAEVTPGWLEGMMKVMLSDGAMAAVQPKVLGLDGSDEFDYCGAAGGEIDILGYPFARGRVFDALEKDNGQYDDWPVEIFWATGAVCLLRRSALDKVGLFEETFFAHMEEIDLNWRMQLAGFRIGVATQSLVRHQTGGTLATGSLLKMTLNHRNNWLMLMRNLSTASLWWLLPLRGMMEFATLIWACVKGDKNRVLAVLKGAGGALKLLPSVFRWRAEIQSQRQVNEKSLLSRMYHGSIAWHYFVKKQKQHPLSLERRH